MKRKLITTVIFCALLAVFLLSLGKLLRAQRRYDEADSFYAELREAVVETSASVVEPHPPQVTAVSEPSESSQATAPIVVDFSALSEENEDIVGWLYCPDTPLSYPVVQGENNEQYLRSDLFGNYLYSGTIFADCRCAPPAANENFILYGHSMSDGSMFGSLLEYKSQSYYDAHPTFYYLTPDGVYRIALFAGAVVDAYDPIYELSGDGWFSARERIRSISAFVSDVEPTGVFFTFSTCSYDYEDARFVLLGCAAPLADK